MKTKILPVVVAFAAVVVLAAALFYLSRSPYGQSGYVATTTTVPAAPGACENLQVGVDATLQASTYFRYGLPNTALQGNVFEILRMTVTNQAGTTLDFSGYTMSLTAGGKNYTVFTFFDIERITPVGRTDVGYPCNELALASSSRLVLSAGQEASGCKMFQIPQDARPDALSLYDSSGMKLCTIPL